MGYFEESLELAKQLRQERLVTERQRIVSAREAANAAMQHSIDICYKLLPELEIGIQELRGRTMPHYSSYDSSRLFNRSEGTKYWTITGARPDQEGIPLFIPEKGNARIPLYPKGTDERGKYVGSSVIFKKTKNGSVLEESFWSSGSETVEEAINARVAWVRVRSFRGVESRTIWTVEDTIRNWIHSCAECIVRAGKH